MKRGIDLGFGTLFIIWLMCTAKAESTVSCTVLYLAHRSSQLGKDSL